MKRVIFLHGVGGSGAQMRQSLEGLDLAADTHFPDAPLPCENGRGRQWMSVIGMSEQNRPERLALAMPDFRNMIESYGDPGESVLVGFSQGAIIALQAVSEGLPAAAVIALSGRLAGPVAPRRNWPPIWLMHGAEDAVIPPMLAHKTVSWLKDANANPSIEIFNDVEHVIDRQINSSVNRVLKSILVKHS